jgi:hypothetical protein
LALTCASTGCTLVRRAKFEKHLQDEKAARDRGGPHFYMAKTENAFSFADAHVDLSMKIEVRDDA